jgi:alkylhydroperoxidase family enzyme
VPAPEVRLASPLAGFDQRKTPSAAFSEKELADLTIAIGVMNALNRLTIGFRNPPKAAI